MKHNFFKILCFCIVGWAASASPVAQSPLTVYALKGPSGVGLIQLFEHPPSTPAFTIKVEALAQADLMAARFISGEAKVGILPPNVAAKIASSGKRIQVAAVLGTGMLSLITSDPSVQSIEDLRGKTVEVAGQSSTPDYVFRRILLAKGMNPDQDLNLSYSLATAEIAQSLIANRVSIALLPEPFATMARSGNSALRLVGDIQNEWAVLEGSGNYPMTVLVVDADFAATQREAMADILRACKASIEWVGVNPAEAGVLVEKYELGIRAPVVQAAIPRSNYVFIPALEARPSLESLFKAFLQFAPDSIGGDLPSDAFYYH